MGQKVRLEGLPEGQYTVKGYEVESSFNDPTAAAVSENVTVNHGAAFWDQGVVLTFTNSTTQRPKLWFPSLSQKQSINTIHVAWLSVFITILNVDKSLVGVY